MFCEAQNSYVVVSFFFFFFEQTWNSKKTPDFLSLPMPGSRSVLLTGIRILSGALLMCKYGAGCRQESYQLLSRHLKKKERKKERKMTDALKECGEDPLLLVGAVALVHN